MPTSLEVLYLPSKIFGSHLHALLSAIPYPSQSPIDSSFKLGEKLFLFSLSTAATIIQVIVLKMEENAVLSLFQVLFLH